MTTWQLDPTGRVPQACVDWVRAQSPKSCEEAYLLAGDWLIANGFYYENNSEARLTGVFGFTDCSGFVVICTNVARIVMGLPAVNVPGNSALQARAAHDLPRPQWMTDTFGWGQGFGITGAQAQGYPSALAMHGAREGQDGFGNGGHVHSKYFNTGYPWAGQNVSIEAADHALDLIHGQFVDGINSYYCISPWLDPAAPPAPPIDWNAIEKLIEWRDDVSAYPLKLWDRGPEVYILGQLLHKNGYMVAPPGEVYGLRVWAGVHELKKRHPNIWPKGEETGRNFGKIGAYAIIALG